MLSSKVQASDIVSSGDCLPSRGFLTAGLSAIPWLIITVLLWAGLFLKPQPVGTTVQPPALERSDNFFGFAAPAEHVYWIVGNNGKVVRSEDDGKVWAVQKTPTVQHLQDVAAWDTHRAVAVGNNNVVITTADAGKTWTESKYVPLSQVSNKLLRVKTLADGRAWAVGEMGALLESTDYGQTWERRRVEEDTAWNDISFINSSNGWLVGEAGRMMKSSDGGKTWQAVNSTVKVSLMAIAFRDINNGLAVGLEGLLLATRNGGKTWEELQHAKRPVESLTSANTASGAAALAKPHISEDASEHLFDAVWDEKEQVWYAVGDQGGWVCGSKDFDVWEAGRISPRDMAWHTRIVVTNGHTYLAGASVGEWTGRTWRAFASK